MGEPSFICLNADESRKKDKKQKGEDKENKGKVRSGSRYPVYLDQSGCEGVRSGGESGARKGVSTVDMSVQTEAVDCTCLHSTQSIREPVGSSANVENVTKLLTQEEVPDEYWQEIVERRRDALNDSLKENEELRSAIEKLRADIVQVSELAQQEEYFKNMIRVLTEEPDFGNEPEAEEDTEITYARDPDESSQQTTDNANSNSD